MKKVSAVELRRLKKLGKVRRKMGAQPEKEKPEPVVESDSGMSGSMSIDQPAPVLPPEPSMPEVQPMASMSASMEYRDGLVDALIEQNAKAIALFEVSLANQKPRPRVPYRHTVNRDSKTSLINEVISTPIES